MADTLESRVTRYRRVSSRLAALDDSQIAALLDEAAPAGTGSAGPLPA